jgi:MFS family permease
VADFTLYLQAAGWGAASTGALLAVEGLVGAGMAGDERRGLAASLNGLSQRLPSSVGPAVGGWLFGLGNLELPFFLAAGLQLMFVVLRRRAARRGGPGGALRRRQQRRRRGTALARGQPRGALATRVSTS